MAWRTMGHRGDVLEDLILITNEFYKEQGYAQVDKIATPVKVMELNERKQVTLGYFDKKSTVDFLGVAQGLAIAFDAKETNQLSFPLSNIHKHQLDYMESFNAHGGYAFVILHFKKKDEYYLLSIDLINYFLKEAEAGGRKSIPYEAMKDAIPIPLFNGRYLNYLEAVNVLIEKRQKASLL